jgi:AP-2 complex subunit mu-1
MSAKGTVLRSDVSGQVLMRTYLSGMPECKLGLNDKVMLERLTAEHGPARRKNNSVELDDVQFHQCVKLGRFDSERTISFVPPDGEFELMRYRTTDNVNLPFKVQPVVNEFKTRVEYKVSVKALFGANLFASNVVIKIPTPPNCARANIVVPIGRAKYAAGENAIVWKIPRFQGDTEYIFSAEAELSSMTVKKQWSRPPISMDFQVLMFTGSGLTVQFLKVFEKSNYKAIKWVRYYTKAAAYQFRF